MDALEPIWMRPERSSRGPRPAHSREQVAAAAVGIADAEGIDAVSMRRVAAVLGTGTTSLYRYVASKDDLLDLMVNAAWAEGDPPASAGDWRTDLRTLATEARIRMLRHPWLPAVSAARPNLGPASLRWTEAWLSAVDGHGLDADALLLAVITVGIYVSGAVQSEVAQRGSDFGAWLDSQGDYGDRIMAGGHYPVLTRVMIEAAGPHAPDRLVRGFTLGLESVLDGVAAALTRAARPTSP